MRRNLGLTILLLCQALVSYNQENNSNPWGIWSGEISSLEIYLELSKIKSDSCQALLTVPVQNIEHQNCRSCTFNSDSISIEFKLPITGSPAFCILKQQRDTLFATWKQEGTHNFKMYPTSEVKKLQRPQTPIPPFIYNEEEIQFFNKRDSIWLSGTLSKLNTQKRVAVILISGSGPQNRNSEIFHHQPFKVISDHLATKGIDVLRYDDRGVGKSQGDIYNATSLDFAYDVAAGVQYLKNELKYNEVGLIGHSEGGLIAPIVSDILAIDFIVSLAGPGIPIKELMLEQNNLAVRNTLLSDEETEQYLELINQLYELIDIETPKESLYNPVRELCDKFYLALQPSTQKKLAPSKEGFYVSIASGYFQPWFRYFINFDPSPFIQKLDCPVLALNGSEDIQVVAQPNLAGFKINLEKGNNQRFEILEFEGLNHLFQSCKECTIAEYAKLEDTFSPTVLEKISHWILSLQN